MREETDEVKNRVRNFLDLAEIRDSNPIGSEWLTVDKAAKNASKSSAEGAFRFCAGCYGI